VSSDDGSRIVHRPIMVREVLHVLRPAPGDVVVDCTLGGGGHALAILERIVPGGRLLGLDVDRAELDRTADRIRAAGFGSGVFTAHHANFTELPRILAAEGFAGANVILADLGISTMQSDDASRGFSYKGAGPLDMRMDRSAGETASELLARSSEREIASLLTENADEPHADLIARLLKKQPIATSHALERVVRTGLTASLPELTKAGVKMSVRRTFQALRIAVNGEFTALDALLASLPGCLAPGGRAAVITFHSGEDRRVKHAFRDRHRDRLYSAIATEVVRSTKVETFANRRAQAAKLRWAIRQPASEVPCDH
jgi:16S rRNA (cytosine1402-N4)-methyltransferase